MWFSFRRRRCSAKRSEWRQWHEQYGHGASTNTHEHSQRTDRVPDCTRAGTRAAASADHTTITTG